MAWLSIQLKVGVVELESVVSIVFFGVEDSDREEATVIVSNNGKFGSESDNRR